MSKEDDFTTWAGNKMENKENQTINQRDIFNGVGVMENLGNFLRLQSLGEAIIINALSSALYILTTINGYTTRRTIEARHCLLFVEKGGLDNTINFFQLELDPDRLRTEFFRCVELTRKE